MSDPMQTKNHADTSPSFCGGSAPSNKLCKNNAFDSIETMRCKLGKQAIVEAVPDYFESKYTLSSARNLSPLERIARLRERVEWGVANAVWSARSDDDDNDDWDKAPPIS